MKKLFVSMMLCVLFSSYLLDESCKQIIQLDQKIKQEMVKIVKELNSTRLGK
jgi:hypothetical protein